MLVVVSIAYCGSKDLISSSLRRISWTGSRFRSSDSKSHSTYDGRKISGFQSKPWDDRTQVISRGGPSGSPILITVCSCLERDVLSKLGLLSCPDHVFGEEDVLFDC